MLAAAALTSSLAPFGSHALAWNRPSAVTEAAAVPAPSWCCRCRGPRELSLTLRPVCVEAGRGQQPPRKSRPEIIVDGSLIRILQFKKRNKVY